MADGEGHERPEFASLSGSRKRSRDERKWKKTVAKEKRNSGKQYTSAYTGKEVAERKVGTPCGCRMGCFDLVGQANIEVIFNDFWKSGKWDIQTAYIKKHTTSKSVKRRRTDAVDKQKNCTRAYHVSVDNIPVTVCKTAFANIHGISRARVDRALASVTATGVLIQDQRGKTRLHGTISEESTGKSLEHIKGKV
ncbi:hypothetical protein Pmani_010709 [Petrolisthes manimaculis]|uniref:Uncharacterized protein n=1 Tax=Petrolisthes manimaculis TaxID=1843537 RepID=A0AAE1Q2L4_9EUCA|nr:hypothetical protein Pmani_010709 [Petrolisthes manimaculis]